MILDTGRPISSGGWAQWTLAVEDLQMLPSASRGQARPPSTTTWNRCDAKLGAEGRLKVKAGTSSAKAQGVRRAPIEVHRGLGQRGSAPTPSSKLICKA